MSSARPSADLSSEFHGCVSAFENEFDYIYQALRRHGLGAADAEDVVQDVFLIMWRRWAEYDRARPLRAWLAGIAFRVAYHHRGRKGREVPGGLIDMTDEQPTPEEHAFETSVRALVTRVLSALPERERTVVRLHDIDGVPMRDIAEVLRIPLQTAHSRLRNGRRNFARLVRRLSTVTDAKTAAAAVLGSAVLRKDEAAAAPDERRQRALLRIRALAPFAPTPLIGDEPAAQPPAPWSTAALTRGIPLAEGLVLCVAVGLLSAVVVRGMRPADAGTVAAVQPAPPPAVARVTPPPRNPGLPPRFVASLSTARRGPGDRLVGSPLAPALSEGLLGYWRFEDGPGSRLVRDVSGNGNDCLLRGPESASRWPQGQVGGALELTGGNWLECPRVERVARLAREMTIGLWVKRTGTEGKRRALVTHQLGGGGPGHFDLGFRGERIRLRSTYRKTAYSETSVARGRWYHVAGTVGRDGTTRVFVDGVEVGRQPEVGRLTVGGSRTPLVIGAAFNVAGRRTPSERLRAIIDEVVIYDRTLSPDEIRALAHRGSSPEESAPVSDEPPAITGSASRPAYIWVEAEGDSVTAPMQVQDDPGASQGHFIAVAAGLNAKKQPAATGQATIRFDVPAAGSYKLWGRVNAASDSDDSFWVRIDGRPWVKWNDIATGTWHWEEVREDDGYGPTTFDLAAGSHTLAVAYREDGAKLDRLLVTSDFQFSPAGNDR